MNIKFLLNLLDLLNILGAKNEAKNGYFYENLQFGSI
jgi:hypothetical protein